MSSAVVSSMAPASCRILLLTLRAAVITALPPTAMLREPKVPMPCGVVSVSLARMVMLSIDTPSSSATIWAKVVSVP